MIDYIIVGIGDAGQYVNESISASWGADAPIKLHHYQKFSDFRKEDISICDATKAIFLVMRLGDSYSDESLLGRGLSAFPWLTSF